MYEEKSQNTFHILSHLVKQEELFTANLEEANNTAFAPVSKPDHRENVWIQVIEYFMLLQTCLQECTQFGHLQSGTSLLKFNISLCFAFVHLSCQTIIDL